MAIPEKAQATTDLFRLLDESLVLRLPDAKSKDDVLRSLAFELAKARGVSDPEAVLAKVQEREAGISTTLDTGLSLPHARLDKVKDFVAVLGLLPQGLPDPQQPDLTIRAMLLFFSPSDPAFFQKHLQFLRHVATLLQPALIERMCACERPADVIGLLRDKES